MMSFFFVVKKGGDVLEKLQAYELAELDYINGMKYKDIAEKYNVSINTVKSWKQRYKWNKDGMRTKEKSMHTKNEKVCTQKTDVVNEVESVVENSELNDKQRLFCLYYVKCFNATKSYQKAYGTDEYTAMVNGSRMLRNAKVRKQIKELKENRFDREMLTAEDIVQKYIDIAFANMADYADFGTESFTYIDKRGEEKEGQASYVRLRDSSTVDGTLIQEVKMGKDGASIKLKDGMKALQWLSDHMYLATEEQRAKIAYIKAQTDKITGEDKGNSVSDDWIEAVMTADKEKDG